MGNRVQKLAAVEEARKEEKEENMKTAIALLPVSTPMKSVRRGMEFYSKIEGIDGRTHTGHESFEDYEDEYEPRKSDVDRPPTGAVDRKNGNNSIGDMGDLIFEHVMLDKEDHSLDETDSEYDGVKKKKKR